MFFANTDYFSPTYAVARDKFRAAASGAGADLHVYDYDRSSGIEEERLSIDVACLGSATSRHKLVVISGTHGAEGYAGSALQTAWLRLCASRRELDHIGVILVHALNPYGFSYGVRTNEDGIDLNRNFVDFSRGRPENRIYDEVHRFLNADIADADRCSHAEAGLSAARNRLGEDALFDAIARGQYAHPDGVFFGGTRRTWENHTLQRIVQAHLLPAEKVAVIDWHTGIGDYGEAFFLPFADAESDAYRRTTQWWEKDGLPAARPHGRSCPRYQGLVFDGIRKLLPHAEVAGGVIEWGTRGREPGELAIRQDLWLRRFSDRYPREAVVQVRADLLDSFVPTSYVWRNSVLSSGTAIVDKTVDGLIQW
jgi:hypothetical protein